MGKQVRRHTRLRRGARNELQVKSGQFWALITQKLGADRANLYHAPDIGLRVPGLI